MHGKRDGQAAQARVRPAVLAALALAVGLSVGACSSSGLNSILGSSKNEPGNKAAGVTNADIVAANNDAPCPSVDVRTGAANFMIGKPGTVGEPAPLDVRYQGTIVNTARECHLNAGVLVMKVGVEGRVITGPAGGPGAINVPLRIAVVHEGISPKTVVSKFASIPVTIGNTVDRVTFTHVDPDVSFPLPTPASVVATYKVYVGFDPQAAQPAKKPARKPRAKPRAKPQG